MNCIAPIVAGLLLLFASRAFAADVKLLDFTASWCQPCREMQPVVDKIEAAGYAVEKVDVDKNAKQVQKYNISALPTFVVIDRDGLEVRRLLGKTTLERLREALK